MKLRYLILNESLVFFSFLYSLPKIRLIKNWSIFIKNCFSTPKKDYIIYNFRDETRYKLITGNVEISIIFETIFLRLYNPKDFEIKENDIILDIGANIGIFSIFASKYAKNGKIYSFEPTPLTFKILNDNIELNNATNVKPLEIAIASKENIIDFYINETYSNTNSIFEEKWKKKIKVNATTLDKIIKKNNLKKIDFLKMDCEGSEYDILFNCSDEILNIVNKISMEYHKLSDVYNQNTLKKFLENKGFKVKIRPFFKNTGYIYAKKK